MNQERPAIVGHGMLAQAFSARTAELGGATVFASGVSNSREVRDAAFAREVSLLQATHAFATGRLLYFSCCALDAPCPADTPYLRHKMAMEERVLADGGVVFRLPQVVGPGGNPGALANFLHAHIAGEMAFEAWRGAQRNLIDVDDVAAIVTAMAAEADSSPLRRVASPFTLSMPDLVALFERITCRPARCHWIDRDDPLPTDATEAVAMAARLGIDFSPGYTERTLRRRFVVAHAPVGLQSHAPTVLTAS